MRGFSSNAKASFAVVIDGDTLRYALDPALKPLFLNLGTQCETVVCCRVSPAQKALVVRLVKEGRNAMTLSIGDGANDVAMIQEANIGVGLFGLEGSQAAMSADYAFGQFRFLTKLLIVHGRWSYRRIADMHSNFFYKVGGRTAIHPHWRPENVVHYSERDLDIGDVLVPYIQQVRFCLSFSHCSRSRPPQL